MSIEDLRTRMQEKTLAKAEEIVAARTAAKEQAKQSLVQELPATPTSSPAPEPATVEVTSVAGRETELKEKGKAPRKDVKKSVSTSPSPFLDTHKGTTDVDTTNVAGIRRRRGKKSVPSISKSASEPKTESVMSEAEKLEKERVALVKSAQSFEELSTTLASFKSISFDGDRDWDEVVQDVYFDIRTVEGNRDHFIKNQKSKEEFLKWLEGNIFLRTPDILGLRDKEKALMLKKISDESYEVDTHAPVSSVVEEAPKAFQKQWTQQEPVTEFGGKDKPEEVSATKPEVNGETLDEKIARLKEEVGDLRMKYAKDDYDNTNAWAKMRKFFGKTLKGLDEREWQERGRSDVNYWQAQYDNKMLELKDAQIASMKKSAGDGVGWKKEMEGMIQYFNVDEVTNLINTRTQYRAEKQNWPTKIFDSLHTLGRRYNELSLKEKLAITAVCAGGTIALTLSGGTAGVALAGLIMGGKRALASAGLAVGTEALLDSSRMKHRIKEAEKEMEKLFEVTPEKGFEYLDAVMKEKMFGIDDELQKAKLTKLLHKAGAITVGLAVGSGWLTDVAMNKLGGGEAFQWVKEHVGNVFGPDEVKVAHVVARPSAPIVAGSGVGIVEQAIPETDLDKVIGSFVEDDYVVQKGDSVWKLIDELADEMGMDDGPRRTHFIDALKDQYGDTLLKEGETINFGEHGIDKEFIASALVDANDITPEEMTSITANNATIAEFAEEHPEVTLTNESVDDILQSGDAEGVEPEEVPIRVSVEEGQTPSSSVESQVSSRDTPVSSFVQETSSSSHTVGIPESTVPTPVYVDRITPSVEAFTPELQPRAYSWYSQIFTDKAYPFQDKVFQKKIPGLKLSALLHDAKLLQQGAPSGYVTGLSGDQINNFAKFSQSIVKSDLGFDERAFFRRYPGATVMDFLKTVAPLTKQGQRFGGYETPL